MSSIIDQTNAAFVHPSAQLYGRVRIGEGSSVWCNVVMRSESERIDIGCFTNIQDFVMVHTDPGQPVSIGDYCSITHHATIHSCIIGHNVLVGVNATIFNGAVIGDNSIIGQHAYVKDGTVVPANSIVVGSPGKVIRMHNAWVANRMNALNYHRNALAYARGDHRAWDGADYERWAEETLADLHRQFEALPQHA